MAAFSNYLEDQITGWIAGTTFAAAPTATFVQLYSQDPGEGGGATGALFTRYQVASGAGSWTRGTGGNGTITNASAFTITSSAASAATATYVAVFSSATGGDLLFYGQLTPTAGKAIAVGDEVKFNVSALTLTVA
jgi:hypothetical protein